MRAWSRSQAMTQTRAHSPGRSLALFKAGLTGGAYFARNCHNRADDHSTGETREWVVRETRTLNPLLVGGEFYAKNSDRFHRGSKYRCDVSCNIKQGRSVVGLVGSRSGGRRVRGWCCRRKRNRDTAVLPASLLL